MAYRPEFEIGDTVTRAAGMFWRNLLPLGGCIAVASIVGVILQVLASLAINGGGLGADEPGAGLDTVITLLISLATASFVSAVNGYAAKIELQGDKPSFGGAWNAGWRNLLPQLGVLILLWLMLIVGWSILLVPGMVLGVLFGFAPAAQVVEGKGVFAAFGESLKASENNRLGLFGYYVVTYILFFVALIVLYGVVALLAVGGVMGVGLDKAEDVSPALMIAVAVIGLPLYVFLMGAIPLALGSITSAAYVSLRRDRGERAVSSVFD